MFFKMHHIQKAEARAAEDQIAFDIFVKNHPKATICAKGNYPEQEGHAAQAKLRIDMDQGKHFTMEPHELHESRPEYLEFPLKVFREHIYQEQRTERYLKQLEASDKAGDKWKNFRRKEYSDSEDESA